MQQVVAAARLLWSILKTFDINSIYQMAFNLSEAERYKQALKHVKDFRGQRGNSAIDWLQDLEWQCGNDGDLARRVLPRKLGSAAVRDWYQSLSNIEKDQYPVLRNRFLAHFVPSSFYSELIRYLEHRRMRKNESVQSFYQAFKEAKSKLGEHCPSDATICRLSEQA